MSTRASKARSKAHIEPGRGDLARLLLGAPLTLLIVSLALLASGRVEASNGAFGDEAASANGFSTLTIEPPVNLVATTIDEETVDLSWMPSPTPGVQGYEVYRAEDGVGGWVLVVSTAGLDYTDTGLEPDTTYHYAVRATYMNWTSGDSNIATATTEEGMGAMALGGDEEECDPEAEPCDEGEADEAGEPEEPEECDAEVGPCDAGDDGEGESGEE